MRPTFLYTFRYQNPLRGNSPNTADQGMLIQAAGMARHTLERRKFIEPYQQYRLFDPQLYLATIDPGECGETVAKLATYPWFGAGEVPQFDSSEMTQAQWKAKHLPTIRKKWVRRVPTAGPAISRAAADSLALQQQIGCAALIAPTPLRVTTSEIGDTETRWWDAAISIRRDKHTSTPLFLTLALSDPLLRDVEPANNPALRQLVAELSARRHEIDGVFLVVAQASTDEYTVSNGDVAASLLHVVRDLANLGGLRVVVGYQGVVGAALVAAGAEAWSSGYYRSLRRLRLADYAAHSGRSYPRFLSREMAGDIGVERFLDLIWQAKMHSVVTETPASAGLIRALRGGKRVADVLAWLHRQANITAAAEHYNRIVISLAEQFSDRAASRGSSLCGQWLARAATVAEKIQELPEFDGTKVETFHQRAWSRAFDDWQASSR